MSRQESEVTSRSNDIETAQVALTGVTVIASYNVIDRLMPLSQTFDLDTVTDIGHHIAPMALRGLLILGVTYGTAILAWRFWGRLLNDYSLPKS